MWWHIILTYLLRCGSRNAFDEKRNSGQAPGNLGELCGQKAQDPRFEGDPTVTCSDNAARHAQRVDPQQVAQIPLDMVQVLLARRIFEGSRLFDHWYVLIVDGTVQEKCRDGFGADGKTASGGARFRYVLQVMLLGPDGHPFPFLHESMDMQDPQSEKQDCELKAFVRLSQRLKKAFPRMPFCWVGDALYGCQTVELLCRQYGWKYVLTLKEGRQPTLWQEIIHLLPKLPGNALRTYLGHNGQDGRRDYRWVENLMLAKGTTHAILAGEITPHSAELYAYITNFSNLTAERVINLVQVGRERHRIEDTFNAQKNHGIGLEHVFCAETNAAKNYYTMMQVAQILWILTCHGGLKRIFQWARTATEQGLARAIGEGLRAHSISPDLPPIGQIRFGFS